MMVGDELRKTGSDGDGEDWDSVYGCQFLMLGSDWSLLRKL